MQKRGLDKRGTATITQTIIHLGMIALAVAAGILMFDYASSLKQNHDFEMLFLSRDIALVANTIYAAPGDVEYIYQGEKQGLSVFNIDFRPVSGTDDKPTVKMSYESASKSYPYAKSSSAQESFHMQNPKSIRLAKTKGQVTPIKNE